MVRVADQPLYSGDDGYLSEPGVRLDTQHRLIALAARQHGVFSLPQLAVLGLGARAVQKRAAAGQLHRIHRGVYAVGPPELLSRNGRYMAAVLACGPGAVLSHRSAAALHELRATDRAGIDVTVPGRTPRRHEGIDAHRSQTFTAADTAILDGIPCTTIARTQLDLAEVLHPRAVERACEQAGALEVLDLRKLEDQLARNRCRHSAPQFRAVLAAYDPGAAPTESGLEEAFLLLCRGTGMPAPERQVYIDPADGEPTVRSDFVWHAHSLVVETDGGRFHRTRRAFEADRRKDQRLTLAGWRVVRLTWRQIEEQPAMVARLLAGLLAAA